MLCIHFAAGIRHIEILRGSRESARLDALITCADIDARAPGATDGVAIER